LNTTSASSADSIAPFHQYCEETGTTLPHAASRRSSARRTAAVAAARFG